MASSCRQEVLHCWMIFSCIRISQVGHGCRRAYFSILVQQQSSFWVAPLFIQLLYKGTKQKIYWKYNPAAMWLLDFPLQSPGHMTTSSHDYLPGLWPAELTGRVVAVSAAPRRWHSSSWSWWQKLAGPVLALHIAKGAGRPAPPAAAPPGARRRHSSVSWGQRAKVKGVKMNWHINTRPGEQVSAFYGWVDLSGKVAAASTANVSQTGKLTWNYVYDLIHSLSATVRFKMRFDYRRMQNNNCVNFIH